MRCTVDAAAILFFANGNRIQAVQTSLESATQTAKIKAFHIRNLRHTCGSWLVQAGVPLLHVAELLGHKDIKTTMRYAHLAPENIRQAVSVLDGLSGLENEAKRVA